MTSAENVLKGVLYFIFALLLILLTYYMLPTFTTTFTDPLTKSFFYISLIGSYAVHLLIVPILLITSKIDTNMGSLAKGAVLYVIGIFYMMISWYIIPEFIEILFNDLSTNTTLYGLFYFFLILSWILALIVIPNFIIFKSEVISE